MKYRKETSCQTNALRRKGGDIQGGTVRKSEAVVSWARPTIHVVWPAESVPKFSAVIVTPRDSTLPSPGK